MRCGAAHGACCGTGSQCGSCDRGLSQKCKSDYTGVASTYRIAETCHEKEGLAGVLIVFHRVVEVLKRALQQLVVPDLLIGQDAVSTTGTPVRTMVAGVREVRQHICAPVRVRVPAAWKNAPSTIAKRDSTEEGAGLTTDHAPPFS